MRISERKLIVPDGPVQNCLITAYDDFIACCVTPPS